MHKGYLCLMLHAHLPFVRHPEEEYFLEENWLFEAITETYIPLINVFDKLIDDNVDFRITMSITPPLANMFQDELLQDRYIRHIDALIELSEKEINRTEHQPHYHGLAIIYHKNFQEIKRIFVDKYNRDLTSAFKKFQDLEFLEIITSCATHGFLPNLSVNPLSVKAQVEIGVESYKKFLIKIQKVFGFPNVDIILVLINS